MTKPFLAVLCFLAALVPAQEPGSSSVFYKEFGVQGEPGSFRAKFNRFGGGLVALQAMDHWKSIEAQRNEVRGNDDYMLLAYNGNDHALRMIGELEQTAQKQDRVYFGENLGATEWQCREFDRGVEFWIESADGGLRLRKTLTHEPQARGFLLEISLENVAGTADTSKKVALELIGAALVNPATTRFIGNSSIALAVPLEGDPVHLGPLVGPPQKFLVDEKAIDTHRLSFVGNTSRFFAAFVTPRNETASEVLSGLYIDTGPPQRDETLNVDANTVTRVRYRLSFPVPAQGERVTAQYGLYFGPKSFRVFDKLPEPERFLPVLDIDLTAPCCELPGARAMAKLLLHLLGWFYDTVDNWGLAIMMLTILVRGLLAPVNFHMQKSMRAYGAKMAVLKPKLDEINKKYEHDAKAKQQAMIAFQRENKMFPPVGGCLPMFLTMPIYIGLFTALRVAYDLRQQPFAFWIHDLSLSDSLFPLPFWPHVFNLLPLLWIGLFLFMVLRQPLPTDPQQRSMQRMMRIMPLMFGFMLYGYASALLLYMVTSMLWSLAESAVVKKILGPVDPNVAAMAPTTI